MPLAVGPVKCCGSSQVLWVQSSAVGPVKCCGSSQVLWVQSSAAAAHSHVLFVSLMLTEWCSWWLFFVADIYHTLCGQH